MIINYVLITAKLGKDKDIAASLCKCEGVTEAYQLMSISKYDFTGEYDFIAKIRTENIRELGSIVVDKIRQTPGIVRAKTLIGVMGDSFVRTTKSEQTKQEV